MKAIILVLLEELAVLYSHNYLKNKGLYKALVYRVLVTLVLLAPTLIEECEVMLVLVI